MSKSSKTAVQIQQAAKQKTLSAAQRKFNNLIKKIDQEKKRLKEWQELMPDFQKKMSEEYQPLLQAYTDLQIAMVKRLDDFHNRRSFTQAQYNKISHVICELCLLLFSHPDTDELKVIYEKHSGVDFDAERDELDDIMGDMMKEMFEDQFGIDLGDDFDHADPQAFAKHVAEKLNVLNENNQPNTKKAKKLTKRQMAQEEKRLAAQKAEQENISQSIKTIYRQLTTAAHPDRETDPDERARKTEIMQRVNTAYEQKDLLKLLALQLELEQIDQHHINTIAEDRLKAYNKILQNQFEQLKLEIKQIELPYRMSMNTPSYETVNPTRMLQDLNRDIQQLHETINQLSKELEFITTVKNMKIWLKDCSLPEDTALPGNLFDGVDDFNLR